MEEELLVTDREDGWIGDFRSDFARPVAPAPSEAQT